MKKSVLVKKYLRESNGQEQYPPLSNARPFTQVNGWNSRKYFFEYYDDKLPFPDLFVSKDGQGSFYLPATKIKNLAKEIFIKFWNDQTIKEQKRKHYQDLESEVEKLYKKYAIEGVDPSKSFENSLRDTKKAKDLTWSLNALVFFSIYFDIELAEEVLSSVGSGITKKRLQALWPIISVPICDSFDTRRKKIFLSANNASISLSDLAQNLRFVEAAYNYVPEPKEVEKIFSEKYGEWLEPGKAAAELERERQVSFERKKKWEARMENFTKEEKRLAEYIQWVIALRDERKDVISKFLAITHIVGSCLFRKANLPLDLLYYSPMDEWISKLEVMKNNKARFDSIRDDAVILINWSGEVEFEFGKAEEVVAVMNDNLKFKSFGEKNILKGQTGSPGKITGTVKVIRDMKEAAGKFFEGDILVTGMTRPEFVPLMKKAAAIITDEGGVTSHAAIVAREMKKPCIIGTKIATQILKDGDRVEVDAEKEAVKILEKNNP